MPVTYLSRTALVDFHSGGAGFQQARNAVIVPSDEV